MTTRYLNFPYKSFPTEADGNRVKRIVWIVTIVTVIPSVYISYDAVKQNKYETEADLFIKKEAVFPNDYLLKKTIDAKNRTITLTYGGQIIEDTSINVLKSKLALYNLPNTSLKIQQGFSFLGNKTIEDQPNPLNFVLSEKGLYIIQLQIESIKSQDKFSKQLYLELKTQYPNISSCIVQNAVNQTDSSQQKIWIALIRSKAKWKNSDKSKINDWLKVRMQLDTIYTYYQ